ncbi:AEC family transporter [Spirochaeta cellobiosiphila]|uniref:AEC family transporter n=1 Tax=Spirochaeta cellobiosiphila TaxID=504483 RepID=UPI0003F9E9A1|nr:AEC family transporter [Spirochaeta cellobiosiphila]
MFYSTFESVFTLFVLIVLGYYLRKKNVFDGDITRGMIQLLLHYTLPAMIFVSMLQSNSKDMLNQSIEMFVLSVIAYVFFGIAALVFTFVLKAPEEDKGVYRFCFLFSNVGFMGYPVIEAVLGEKGVFYAAIFNIPFNFLAFSLGVLLLTKGKSEGQLFSWKILISPPLVATFIGFIFFITGFTLPEFILKPIDLIGSITTPLSMITIGSLLAVLPVRDIAKEWRLFVATVIRLLLIPFTLWLILRPWFSGVSLYIPIIVSAMPAAANAPILSEKYGGKGSLASQFVFVSTLFSLITIPIWSYLLLK